MAITTSPRLLLLTTLLAAEPSAGMQMYYGKIICEPADARAFLHGDRAHILTGLQQSAADVLVHLNAALKVCRHHIRPCSQSH